MLYLVVFLCLAFLAALTYLIKIKVAFEYVRNEEDDNMVISFYTMKGVFKYKYEIPLINADKGKVKFRLVKEQGRKEKVTEVKKKKLKPLEIFVTIGGIRNFYIDNKQLICDIRDYLRTRLLMVEFNLNIKEGTGNACHTAILSGLMWSAAGILSSWLSNSVRVLKKCVTINPCFDNAVFTIDFLCIFHIRLVHIIVVLKKIYSKKKHKIKTKLEKEIGGGLSG